MEKLDDDIKIVKTESNSTIKLICITGDLINNGANSAEYDSFMKEFLSPLLDKTKLQVEDVFIVPGNHEIDRNSINKFEESGLVSELTSSEDIADYFKKDNSCDRLKNFYKFFNDYSFNENSITSCNYYSTYMKELEGIKIGVACLNSSWRSTGTGSSERGKMIVGVDNVKNALHDIQDTQIKIALVHHPLDWLVECDYCEIQKNIQHFDLILNGHVHALDTKQMIAYQGQSITSTCGKFMETKDSYNGYSFISINSNNYQIKIYLRKYYSGARNCFDRDLEIYENGCAAFSLCKRDELSQKTYEIIYSIQQPFVKYANSFFIGNLLEANKAGASIESLFVCPPLAFFSEYQKEANYEMKDFDELKLQKNYIQLDDLIYQNDENLFFSGKKECGKTTLINYWIIMYLKKFPNFGKIPVLIDFKDNFKGKEIIVKKISEFFNDFSEIKLQLSYQDIKELLEQGKFVLFFDNVEELLKKENTSKLDLLKQFIIDYPNNRFIYFAREEPIDEQECIQMIDSLGQQIVKVFIHSLGKKQIRTLAKKY